MLLNPNLGADRDDSAESPAQTNFEWISNKSAVAYVTIDSHHRLYISKPARELLELPSGKYRLIAGYDYANHRIVLAKPEVVRVPDIEPFNFDKRSYSKVKRFVDRANLGRALPVRFFYVGKDYSDLPRGTFAFQRSDRQAEDV